MISRENFSPGMEEELTEIDFPELSQAPCLDFDDQMSFESVDIETRELENGSDVDDGNIAKVHEYLDRDLADQEALMEKLIVFEESLNKYLSKHNK